MSNDKEYYIKKDEYGGYNVFEGSSYDSYDMSTFDWFPLILWVPFLIILGAMLILFLIGQTTGVTI